MNKKNIIVLAIFVLVVVGVVFLLQYTAVRTPATTLYGPEIDSSAGKYTGLPNSQIPKGLPKGVPIEASSTVIVNFEGTVLDQNQSTREFVSDKTLVQNLDLYKTWLTKNGWQGITVTDLPTQKIIFAGKGEAVINIRIYTGPDKKVHVLINTFVKQ